MQDEDPRKVMLRTFWWHEMDSEYRIRMHLRDRYPGTDWASLFLAISNFCTFKNSIRELEVIAQTSGQKYKFGATCDLDRRIHELGLAKYFQHLYFIVTSGVQESAEVEESLITFYRKHSDESIRSRCINNTRGGEGLGSAMREGPHFVYIAVK